MLKHWLLGIRRSCAHDVKPDEARELERDVAGIFSVCEALTLVLPRHEEDS